MKERVYIPEQFEKAVVVHALRIGLLDRISAPLFLGINGFPGEGKTFLCKIILQRLGYKVYQLSGGLFESKDAGEPARIIRETYEKAQCYCGQNNKNRAAIIIDDADVAFGNWGEMYQYTVNTQNILAEFMNLADYHKGDSLRVRIPIYLTGNDLGKIYAPLRRSGRMVFFHWAPTRDDRLHLLYSLYPSFTCDECNRLLDYVSNKLSGIGRPTFAFFSDLKACEYDEQLWEKYVDAKKITFFGGVFSHIDCSVNLPPLTLPSVFNIVDNKVLEIQKSRRSYVEMGTPPNEQDN